MFICNNCNSLLENTVPIHEYHDELDDKFCETYYVCPYCKSDDVDEAVQCSICGEYISHDYIVLKTGQVICSNCYTMY